MVLCGAWRVLSCVDVCSAWLVCRVQGLGFCVEVCSAWCLCRVQGLGFSEKFGGM